MTELELIKLQLNMANSTISHLENTREIFLNKINELQKQNNILKEKLHIAESALQKIYKPSSYDMLFSPKNYKPTKDERGEK